MALKDNCILHAVLGAPGEITSPLIGAAGTEYGSPTYEDGQLVIDGANEGANFPNTNDNMFGSKGRVDVAIRPDGWTIVDGHPSGSPTGVANDLFWWSKTPHANNYFHIQWNPDGNDFYWNFRTSGGGSCNPYYNLAVPLMDSDDGEQHVMSLVWNTAGIGGGSNTRELYWDGDLIWSTTNALTTIPVADTDYSLDVGHADRWISGLALNGKVDWLKVYDDDDNDMTLVMYELFNVLKVWPFTTPGNYTFDTDKIEVTSGVGRLKPTDPDLRYYARWDANKDAAYSRDGGSKTVTLAGAAAYGATSGKWDGGIDMKGGVWDTYARIPGANNWDNPQVGTIAVQVKPDYSNDPATHQRIPETRESDGGLNSNMDFYHATNGDLVLFVRDNVGSTIIDEIVEYNWQPVSGTYYRFEINYNLTTGATRVFRNGTQLGSTLTGTGTRSASDMAVMHFGGWSAQPDMTIDEVAIWSAVKHTANFTPPSAVLDVYATDTPTITTNESVAASAYDGFVVSSTSDGATIKFTIEVGGQQKYWTGAAWANSNGTYAQANTAAEINANIATLTAGVTKIVAFLPSNGIQRPAVDEIELSYTSVDGYRKQQTLNRGHW